MPTNLVRLALVALVAVSASAARADDRFGFPAVRAGRSLHYRATITDPRGTTDTHEVVVRLSAPSVPPNGTTRVVRVELLDAASAPLVPRIANESLPSAIYVNRRGLRLEERGTVSLPTRFSHLPEHVDPFARPDRVIASHGDLEMDYGCLSFGHVSRETGARESWRACFDASGTLRRYVSESAAGRFELVGPVATPEDFVGSWFTGADGDDDTTYEAAIRRGPDGRLAGEHVTSSAASIECALVGRAAPHALVVDVRCLNRYVSDEDPEITEGACALAIEAGALEIRSVRGEAPCPVGGPPLARSE